MKYMFFTALVLCMTAALVAYVPVAEKYMAAYQNPLVGQCVSALSLINQKPLPTEFNYALHHRVIPFKK